MEPRAWDMLTRSTRAAVVALAFSSLAGCAPDVIAPLDSDDTPGADEPGLPGAVAMGVGINIGFYNPGAGMKVFRDGYDTGGWLPSDQPFDAGFLSEMAPFETIRFTQFHRTSFSDDVRWSDRVPPDYQAPLTGWIEASMPYEWEIRLSNRLGANYWIGVPAMADADYLRQLAALVHAELDPDLKVYLEWSNEVWNPDFAEGGLFDDAPGYNGQHTFAADRGVDLGLADGGSVDQARASYHVYATVRMWSAFMDEFDDDSRLVKVLAGINDNQDSYYSDLQLAALADSRINPAGLRPDRYAVGAYVGLTRDGASASLFSAELPADLSQVVRGIEIQRASLDAAGYEDVPIIAYEGGTHMIVNADVASRDPRVYQVIIDLLDEVEAAGMVSFQNYVATSAYNGVEGFGFNEFTGQAEAQAHKWRALRDWIAGN